MMPKFIRFKGDIIHLSKIVDINYRKIQNITTLYYDNGKSHTYYGGDYRDDIWELMKLALKPTPMVARVPEGFDIDKPQPGITYTLPKSGMMSTAP